MSYGENYSQLKQLIGRGYLPSTFENFRQIYLACWDIETLETKQDLHSDTSIQIEALHSVVSIRYCTVHKYFLTLFSVSSNLPGCGTEFFCRKSSEPEAAVELISEFLNHLWSLEQIYHDLIPCEITDAMGSLKQKIITEKFSKSQTVEKRLMAFLQQFQQFPCYGYNSGEFMICFCKSESVFSQIRPARYYWINLQLL